MCIHCASDADSSPHNEKALYTSTDGFCRAFITWLSPDKEEPSFTGVFAKSWLLGNKFNRQKEQFL